MHMELMHETGLCILSPCEVTDVCSLLPREVTIKPVLSGHSIIDKTKILMTNVSLMKVESFAECSPLEHSAMFLTCIKR